MIFDPDGQARATAFNLLRHWESEPDYRMFDAAGLKCVVSRMSDFGHLCGYVGVGRSHPLYGVSAIDLVPAPDAWKVRPFDVDEHGIIDTFIMLGDLQRGEIPEGYAPLHALIGVHGGLNWSAPLPGHTGWWLGFDCMHAGDFAPGMADAITQAGGDASFLYACGIYRTFDYVMGECAALAQQIADWSARIEHIDKARELIARMREMRKEP